VYNRAKEITDQKVVEKYGPELDESLQSRTKRHELKDFSDPSLHVSPSEDSKVEEIRISRPQKAKNTVEVKSEEDAANEASDKKSRDLKDSDWYKGADEIKYEIDKITGEIDEEGMDKWFEGVDGIKKKIDKRIKKKKGKEEK
jgi:hypothetical protein